MTHACNLLLELFLKEKEMCLHVKLLSTNKMIQNNAVGHVAGCIVCSYVGQVRAHTANHQFVLRLGNQSDCGDCLPRPHLQSLEPGTRYHYP